MWPCFRQDRGWKSVSFQIVGIGIYWLLMFAAFTSGEAAGGTDSAAMTLAIVPTFWFAARSVASQKWSSTLGLRCNETLGQ